MSQKDSKKGERGDSVPERSIYFSDERIDREGNTWKRRSFWFRQEHLGKLKVIAHFQKKKTQVLIDRALRDFIEKTQPEPVEA